MAETEDRRPFPPVNFTSENWLPYTRLIPATEIGEWVNQNILSEEGRIHNPAAFEQFKLENSISLIVCLPVSRTASARSVFDKQIEFPVVLLSVGSSFFCSISFLF
ncbi:hypothetical protein DMS64_04030 [Klebsiella variicola]|nr:hypothetical protein [Klebsiella variicola]PXM29308.1 hypothetical protein DMS64_04030 [Klebsiella variicola]